MIHAFVIVSDKYRQYMGPKQEQWFDSCVGAPPCYTTISALHDPCFCCFRYIPL